MKVGDIVKCIESDGYLVVDNIYKITKVRNNFVDIFGYTGGFFRHRFKIVTREEKLKRILK